MNKCSMQRFASPAPRNVELVMVVWVELQLVSPLDGFVCDSTVMLASSGRYNVADRQTCSMPAPKIKMVPWKPKFRINDSISIGNTKLPAAVPATHIPFAKARRLLKYIETIIMPGVVDRPPPIPKYVRIFVFEQEKMSTEFYFAD